MRLTQLKNYSPILLTAAATPLFGSNGCTVEIDGFNGRSPFYGTVDVYVDRDDHDDFFDDLGDFFDDLDDDLFDWD